MVTFFACRRRRRRRREKEKKIKKFRITRGDSAQSGLAGLGGAHPYVIIIPFRGKASTYQIYIKIKIKLQAAFLRARFSFNCRRFSRFPPISTTMNVGISSNVLVPFLLTSRVDHRVGVREAHDSRGAFAETPEGS